MHPDEILDNELFQGFQQYLFDKEKILWEGEPNLKFNIVFWDKVKNDGTRSNPLHTKLIYLSAWTMIFLISKIFFNSGRGDNILAIVIGLAFIIVLDVLKYLRKKNTRYAVTCNRVFFQLWRWGKKSIHFVDFADIGKITYQEYNEKTGIIHFLPKKPIGFCTYDFETSERRFYPTFELVPNVIELHKQLEELWMERIKSKMSEA